MLPPEQDIESRTQVWSVLAEFYLDNQIDRTWFATLAKQCARSSYTLLELHRIMFGEVFRAMAVNLMAPAGAWGMSSEEIKDVVLGTLQGRREKYYFVPCLFWPTMYFYRWPRFLYLVHYFRRVPEAL